MIPKPWEQRMSESGRRECESLAVELMQAEINDWRKQAQCAAPDERAAFEAEWAAPRLASIHRHDVIGGREEYLSFVTEAAWTAWQAARATLAAQPAKAESGEASALAILREFISDSQEHDIGGGDVVVTTCEVREKAVKLLNSLRDPSLGVCGVKPADCPNNARCGCATPAMGEELPQLPEGTWDERLKRWTITIDQARDYGRACMALRQPGVQNSIPVPTSADMAHAMVNLGLSYLKEYAPERLKAQPVAAQKEPVGKVYFNLDDSFYWAKITEQSRVSAGDLLYTAPPPAPVAVPAGWKLVPVQPTDKMTFIGQSLRYDSVNSIGEIYRQMIAAAPSAPVGGA
jgi:hypothetical protein